MNIRELPYSNLVLFLSSFDIEESAFIAEYLHWSQQNPDLEFSEFMWSYFERTATRIAREAKSHSELYSKITILYGYMLYFKTVDERQRPGELLNMKHYYELMATKSTGLEIKVFIIGRRDCKKCANIEYEVDLVKELKKLTLPFKRCPMVKKDSYLFCSCTYGFKVVRGEDGLPMHSKY